MLSASDCEAILHVYMEKGEEVCNMLDGIFAFVLVDTRTSPPTWIAGRDPIGVLPMYYGYRADGSVMFASEMKCLVDECPTFELFPPGHLMTSADTAPRRWYNPTWVTDASIPREPLDLTTLREKFEGAVVKRMMCDVPYGVLLSGGLDSSLVASIASRHAKKRVESGEELDAWWPRLHTFSIGLKGSPDLENARLVAEFLGTVHHEYTFTLEEGLDAVSEVIQMVETYDITSIRASTPMYLMSRKIKALGVKMVLSGEGADEIFGGYLYFHKAPDAKQFHEETVRKMQALHLFDCNRANKSTSAWGVEARVPFLDKEFVNYSMQIDPQEKMIKDGRIEKWMVRAAFDTPDDPYLPKQVLWRQKEQFSDGVGYSWIDTLKDVSEKTITDAQMASAAKRFPHNTPGTKEGYWYREIFESHFKGHKSALETVPGGPTVACSTATAVEWDASFKLLADASGRAVGGVHVDAYATEPASKKAKTQ
eukprot:TRINITY_DN17556_c0_g1_i1.p1 TRINITY_DN17556_c0_g1~~TRINITY_DN17556_c0_g1_i1.p1  ORF type:complete len:481 (-),score=156.52 TRINITY_DN17556_c0_g1_i1:91-1533(-)